MWSKENSGWFIVSWEVWILWFEFSNVLSILDRQLGVLLAETGIGCSLREGRLVTSFAETGMVGTCVPALGLDGGDVN